MSLLIATFCISFAVSTLVVLFFNVPIKKILQRIISDEIYKAWTKYMRFAIYITGISSGVRVWDLEKYISERTYEGAKIIELTQERWVLEIYRTVIGTLQGIAWMLLVFFVFALIAYVIVRVFEMKKYAKTNETC
jgi:hypothetical protein